MISNDAKSMMTRLSGNDSAELQWICRSTLQSAFPSFRSTDVRASFYPYIGLTHTIRRKGSCWVLRISDHCARAPRIVIEAITVMLACKVLRRTPPAEMLKAYERFRRDPCVEAAVADRRLKRGRKVISRRDGRHHILRDIYGEANRRFFDGQVDVRMLGWSARRSWSRLGHYDPVHHSITISPVLDSPAVPRYVVAYILYHEMLHALFGDVPSAGGRRRHHPPEFRRAETSHPDYAAAKKFLGSFCRRRGK